MEAVVVAHADAPRRPRPRRRRRRRPSRPTSSQSDATAAPGEGEPRYATPDPRREVAGQLGQRAPARRRRSGASSTQPDERGADDHAVGVRAPPRPPGRRWRHRARPPTGRSVTAWCARTSGAGEVAGLRRGRRSRPSPRSRRRSRGRLGGVARAARRSTTARPGRPGRGRAGPRRRARPGLVGGQVGGDQAGAAGRGEVGGEAVDAVALDRVPVGHHHRRARRSRRPPRRRAEHVAGADAALERLLGGGLDRSGRP